MSAASDCSAIFIGPGTWEAVNVNVGARSLALVGTHGREATVLDAAQAGRGLILKDPGGDSTWTLDRLTVENGWNVSGTMDHWSCPYGYGGAIYQQGGSLLISNSTIRSSRSETSGSSSSASS